MDKQIAKEQEVFTKLKKSLENIDYACLPDAQAAAARISPPSLHELVVDIEPRPQYARGRPKADGNRILKETRFGLKLSIRQYEQAITRLREEAGCFVLITNISAKGTGSISARELLTIYKDQHTVENNFAFLKDPVFVNALFLKTARRIEALGLVLILALMIWRLMERTMRANLAATKSKVTGWEKRQTSRPTSLIMTTKFIGVFILVSSMGRRLARPLEDIQRQYLKLLELTPECLVTPYQRKRRITRRQ